MPWATSWDAEYLTTDDRFDYHRCAECDVLFIDPVPADRLGQIYPPNYYSFRASGRSILDRIKARLDARFYRRIVRRIPGSSLSVLDVGGGSGSHLGLLKSIEPRITRTVVVDFNDSAAVAAKQHGHEYVATRIEDFESESCFDLVLLLNLIEHVATPLAVLRKVATLLTPDGMLIIKTPNHASLDASLFRYANWGGYHCPRHWVLFTRESFARLAARAGLAVSWFTYTQGAPFWTTSILVWLAERKLISITRGRPAVCHPLYAPLAAAFAAFDFGRLAVAKTSQMFFVLHKSPASNPRPTGRR